MIQSFEAILPMLKERQIADAKSKAIKKLIIENNQEADGIKRQRFNCLTGLLYCNSEEADEYDTSTPSL